MPDYEWKLVPKPYETSGTDLLDNFVPKDLVLTQAEKDSVMRDVRKAVEESEALQKIADPILSIVFKLLGKIPLAAL